MKFGRESGKKMDKKGGGRPDRSSVPPRCPLCGDILTGRQIACPDCLKKEQPIREPRCKKCGKALRKEEQEYCEDCEKRKHLYTEGRGIFPYQGGMKKALLDLKYQGKRENALFLGRKLWRIWAERMCSDGGRRWSFRCRCTGKGEKSGGIIRRSFWPGSVPKPGGYRWTVRRWSGRTGQKRRKTWIRKNGEKILPVLLERERAERIIKIY